MAIPKKGARSIVVEGESYKWLIRRKATYSQTDYGNGYLNVAVEHAENPGSNLVIITDRRHPKDYNTGELIPITPSDISNWIKEALKKGWAPTKKGTPFMVKIKGDAIILLN